MGDMTKRGPFGDMTYFPAMTGDLVDCYRNFFEILDLIRVSAAFDDFFVDVGISKDIEWMKEEVFGFELKLLCAVW